MRAGVNDLLHLAPPALHILLALAGEKLHGYGIMREILRQSDGKYKLGPGALYDNLQRLMKQGLVEEIDGGPDERSRRRYYMASSLGLGVLSAEIARLEGVVKEARMRRAPEPRRV